MKSPLLIEIPLPIVTPRLLIRGPELSDATQLNEAICESHSELQVFLPWAFKEPTLDETTQGIATAQAQFILREDLRLHIFDRLTGRLLGASGLHRINWSLPSFEIGYWVRSSEARKGYITESTLAITNYAFEKLSAKRVEIRSDSENHFSLKIPERLGFTKEGILRNKNSLVSVAPGTSIILFM